jgi:succinyl-CoA synthetase beta subunit
VIQAFEKVDLKIPVGVRLASTSVEKGRKLLKDSGLPIAHAEALFDFPGPVLIFH